MSQVARALTAWAGSLLLIAALAAGCSNGSSTPSDPDPGPPGDQSPHPPGWIATHSSSNRGEAPSCAQCHDNPANNLQPNCFNGSLCHAAPDRHPATWASRDQHGAVAKAVPPGMASCTTCHGDAYDGGLARQSCFPCHGWNAPHARSGWDGGGFAHRSTSQSNADACAQCHRSQAGTAGCFNNTLCHGG